LIAGLLFSPGSRSHAAMDESIERTIPCVIEEARGKGRDHLTQTELAEPGGMPGSTRHDGLGRPGGGGTGAAVLSRNQMIF
jgi:hypothetical protein